MRSLAELRDVVNKATGCCRISWSPEEAEHVLKRIEALEERFTIEVDRRTAEVVTECHEKVRRSNLLKEQAEAVATKHLTEMAEEVRLAKSMLANREWQLAKASERSAQELNLLRAAEEYVNWCKGEGELDEREVLWKRLIAAVDDLGTIKAEEPAV
jgi:hypothetical protein